MEVLHKACKIFSAGLLPIRRNLSFCVFMYVLGIISAYATLRRGWKMYTLEWEELYFDIYLLAILLTLLSLKARRWAKGLLYVIAYGTAVVDMYCFVKFDSTLNPTMLLLVGETNGGEAAEFLESYINFNCHVLFTS